jgi:predicted dehydrogenase
MTYSVALIGLGGIGMCYDSKLPAVDYVFSHARAFALHPDFVLLGAVDPVADLREQFESTYKAATYATVQDLLSQGSADVVVVASPTRTHLEVVRTILLSSRPKLILCEKPLAYDSAEADEIVRLCREQGVLLFVNYIRRADPGVISIKARLDSGQIRVPFKAVVWYSKGLLHNGTHFSDLLTFWFGQPRTWSIIAPGESLGEQDAEPDFCLFFDDGMAIFCAAKEENFSHYTVEIVAQNGRLRYEQGGAISWQAADVHPLLGKRRQLQLPGEEIRNDMNRYQYHVVTQISQALQKKEHTLCDGISGAATIRLLEALLYKRVENQE